jgi:hypothetical protein
MANATGSRHYDDAVREAAGLARASGVDALAAEHSEALVASVAADLDRLSEQIFGSGCTLSLTDSSGAVLYERSDGIPARAERTAAAVASAADAGPIFVSFPAGNLHRPM